MSDRVVDQMTCILWWVKNTMHTYVTIDDERTGQHFRVETPEGENPNNVFYHPFSYKMDEIVQDERNT